MTDPDTTVLQTASAQCGDMCICDPNDLFEPPWPEPRAVEGCSAHRARRAAQLFTERHRDD